MAVIQKLVCDRHLSNDPVEEVEAGAGTHSIAVDRKAMEMELCDDCLEELTALLEPFMACGRRSTPTSRPSAPKPPRATPEPATGASGTSDTSPSVRDNVGEFLCRWEGGKCPRQTVGFNTGQGRAAHERGSHRFHAPKAESSLRRDGYGYSPDKDKGKKAKERERQEALAS